MSQLFTKLARQLWGPRTPPQPIFEDSVRPEHTQQLKREAEAELAAIRDRIVAFASQLQAWGYDAGADELLREILTGPVEAPDYYAVQADLQAKLTENAHLREALHTAEQQAAQWRNAHKKAAQRADIASAAYDQQQSSYRELEALYQAMTKQAQALTEQLHLCRDDYQNMLDDMACDAGNWDGGSTETCEHCHLVRTVAMLDAVLNQSGVK